MFKFKVGDEVIVTAGKDKGKKGKVEKVFPKENKLVVEKTNLYKRHKKATRTQAAGIYQIARPIPASAVAIICPKCSRPTRVGFTIEGKTKIRICKRCQGSITFKEAIK